MLIVAPCASRHTVRNYARRGTAVGMQNDYGAG